MKLVIKIYFIIFRLQFVPFKLKLCTVCFMSYYYLQKKINDKWLILYYKIKYFLTQTEQIKQQRQELICSLKFNLKILNKHTLIIYLKNIK